MYLFSLKDPEEITFVLSAEEIQTKMEGREGEILIGQIRRKPRDK
jgi:hypothetical protein